jgi:hypothetical protein
MMSTIEEIFASDKIKNFWPSSTQTPQENTFSIIRFILYASVLVYLITGDYRITYLGLAVIAYMVFTNVQVNESYAPPHPSPSAAPPVHQEPKGSEQIIAPGIPQDTPNVPNWSLVHPNIDTTSLQQRFFKMPENNLETLKKLHGGNLGRKDTVPYFLGGRNGR